MICQDCGYESKMPIHDVDVIIEGDEYWCAKCVDIIFKGGEVSVLKTVNNKGRMIKEQKVNENNP